MNRTQTLIASLLLATAGAASAADYSFTGLADDGRTLSGSFSFEDVATGFDGAVTLSRFTLSFAGTSWSLLDADAPASALFAAGSFIGVDFVDVDNAARPTVQLTAGFGDVSEAVFAYGTVADGVQGYGSLNFSATPIPEPASAALLLAGLAGVGALKRRSSQRQA